MGERTDRPTLLQHAHACVYHTTHSVRMQACQQNTHGMWQNVLLGTLGKRIMTPPAADGAGDARRAQGGRKPFGLRPASRDGSAGQCLKTSPPPQSPHTRGMNANIVIWSPLPHSGIPFGFCLPAVPWTATAVPLSPPITVVPPRRVVVRLEGLESLAGARSTGDRHDRHGPPSAPRCRHPTGCSRASGQEVEPKGHRPEGRGQQHASAAAPVAKPSCHPSAVADCP